MRNFLKLMIFIILFIFLISLSSYLYYLWRKSKQNNPKYNISILIQDENKKYRLTYGYLAELLDLSFQKSENIYTFNINRKEEKLLKSPFIKSANIKKYKPNALLINYEMREPFAVLDDYKNIAIDKERYFFPYMPYYKKEKLTKIFLGEKLFENISTFAWNEKISSDKLLLAYEILNIFKSNLNDLDHIEKIDVSKVNATSYGQREIVIKLIHKIIPHEKATIALSFPRIIRLCVKGFEKQIYNYFSLHHKMIEDYKKQLLGKEDFSENIVFTEKVIDMRLAKLAFIDK